MTDDDAPRRRPRRTVVWWLGACVVLAAFVLLAAELAVRIDDWREGRGADFYLPDQAWTSAMYEPHHALGVVLRPGWERSGEYRIRINALGLRGPETTREKPPGVYRIVCIGGSTTFGTGATADDRTYPARLQELLDRAVAEGRAPAGRRYEVLNGGVSGYTSADSLIHLELRLLELSPDAVISYDAPNDGRMIQARDFRADYSHLRRPPPIVQISALERFLLGNVRVYARLVRGTDPEEQLGALADWVFVPGFKDKLVSSHEWLNEDGLAVLARNLRNICAVARAAGAQPVLQTFAVRRPDDPINPELGPFIVRANEVIRALGAELDVPVAPVAETLTGHPELYDNWSHFNDAGELAHAQAVADFAARQGLFGLR